MSLLKVGGSCRRGPLGWTFSENANGNQSIERFTNKGFWYLSFFLCSHLLAKKKRGGKLGRMSERAVMKSPHLLRLSVFLPACLHLLPFVVSFVGCSQRHSVQKTKAEKRREEGVAYSRFSFLRLLQSRSGGSVSLCGSVPVSVSSSSVTRGQMGRSDSVDECGSDAGEKRRETV